MATTLVWTLPAEQWVRLRRGEDGRVAEDLSVVAVAADQTRMRLGEGLVGRTARTRQVVNTADAPAARGFRYMPETGEERYASFCGVPIQRLGEVLGVLVVQSLAARELTPDEVYALEVVAMVLAEMTELGAFVGGIALGILQAVGVVFFDAGYKNVVAFTILLLLLFLRPQGIFKSLIE